MRRILAWLLVVLGVILCLPSLAAAIWVGTDDTATTGPHSMTTAGVAIMTEAEVLHYVGPVLHLTVERDDGGPVFVGVAQDVDAESYLFDHGRRVVTRVGLPWDVESGEQVGTAEVAATPGDQPWWLASVEGAGPQELVWSLPHGRYSIVALNSDGTAGLDVEVTLGLEIPGTFYTLLAVAAAGLLLVLIGAWLLLRRRRRARKDAGQPSTDVYVEPAAGVTPTSASSAAPNPSPYVSTPHQSSALDGEPTVVAPLDDSVLSTPGAHPADPMADTAVVASVASASGDRSTDTGRLDAPGLAGEPAPGRLDTARPAGEPAAGSTDRRAHPRPPLTESTGEVQRPVGFAPPAAGAVDPSADLTPDADPTNGSAPDATARDPKVAPE